MEAELKWMLENNTKVYIAGAQSRAESVAGYLKELFPHIKLLAYLVDEQRQNRSVIEGIPVLVLKNGRTWELNAVVLIATKGVYHEPIRLQLLQLGFEKIYPVIPAIDTWFRNQYVCKAFKYKQRQFLKIEEISLLPDLPEIAEDRKIRTAFVYMAQSVLDKPLQRAYHCPTYERPIQVGAGLTQERIGVDVLTDCEGEHISERNRQYCELTGLYWLWKHATDDVIGLSHYRRHFILPEDWVKRMEICGIDVILPVPAYVAPSVAENYKERHDSFDWEYLMEYLKSREINEYHIAKKIFSENLYLTCNMLIARKKVLDQLCIWLFPILDAVAIHGGIKTDDYANRYPGFISERLVTLFFELHYKDYNIVYADKVFLS